MIHHFVKCMYVLIALAPAASPLPKYIPKKTKQNKNKKKRQNRKTLANINTVFPCPKQTNTSTNTINTYHSLPHLSKMMSLYKKP